ncbi:MAG: hypothetical protein HFE79_00100 [Ruminiclostridium sp.]|nr:hypothetical protein [Ruminiclostridium sp.]
MRKSNITTTTDKKSNKTQAQIFNILDQYYTYNTNNHLKYRQNTEDVL